MTRCKAISLFCALFLLAGIAAGAQKRESRFTFMGADAGTNTFERLPDGTFSSRTELNIGGMKITSTLTGKYADGVLTEYQLEQSQAGVSGRVVARAGKVTAEQGEHKREGEYKPSKIVFANFHPAISASLHGALPPTATGSQKVDLLILDAGVAVSANLARLSAKTVDVAGVRRAVQVYQLRLPSVDMEVSVSDDGGFAAWDVPAQMLRAVAAGYEELVVDPTTRMPELSQPTLEPVTEKGVKVPMRDGVALAADVARPKADGKYPAILARTPYGRGAEMAMADWWARRGYVYVAQDVRGRGDSDGAWEPFANERKDGYDTIDWISKQAWSNGSVGMIGGSYVGIVQWYAAVEGHPALKCIVPQVSPPDPFLNFPVDHGIPFIYGAVWWSVVVKDKGPLTAVPKLDKLETLKVLPIARIDDELHGATVPFLDNWWRNETASSFGSANYMADLGKVRIPALHISGWWDGDGIGTKLNWATMATLKRTNQWLIYGPWTHAFNTTTQLGDTDYGPNAILELNSVYLRWFDTWLKGKDVGLERMPRVRAFVTGANKWVDLTQWPDPNSKERVLYLGGSGPANSPDGAGALTAAAPPAGAPPDRYTYNPAVAVIPKELANMDPSDASTVVQLDAKSQATLVYRTEPLEAPLAVAGPISVDLYVSSTAVDTDFYADLVDIDDKGVIRAIGRGGKIRAKYHRSFDKPELLKPGKTYRLKLNIWDTAHQFAKGHRVGLLISSDGFPIYARNLGTGEPWETGTRMVAQSQTVYRDARRPSAVRFRVLTLP